MAFRRGLRSLLLKTHPDLFAQPADAAKRADNEASLAILNTLVDGATALAREEPATVRFTNPRLHLRLHRRTGGTAIEHHVEVPEWLQRGSRDSEAVRRWCTDSVMALLVTAGEAVPTQVTQQAGQGSDWLAVPAVDFAALRREVYETLVFGRDPSQPGQTDAQWAAQLHQARCNYWLARVIIAPSVTLLQSHQTLDMLRAFAREERELFEAVFAIPVHVVPSAMDYAGDESALLLCPWNTSLSEWAAYAAARQQSVTEAARVRASQVRFLLAGCDELCVQGQWQGVALSQALLGCDPRVALDALVSLVRDDAEGLLHGCQVHASLGHPALSTVDTKLHENSDGTVCPSVRVRIAYDVAWTPTLHFRYHLGKLQSCAKVINAKRAVKKLVPHLRDISFAPSISLRRRALFLNTLLDVARLLDAPSSQPPLALFVGDASEPVSLNGDTLRLPVTFDVQELFSGGQPKVVALHH